MHKLTKRINYGIQGIPDKLLENFRKDPNLTSAINSSLLILNNKSNYHEYQKNILNFYNKDTIVPYLPVAAKGPWIIASNGALLYDVGGYGMLGFGHSPDWCLEVLSKPHVMANIMTPNSIQLDFTNILQEKIGINRDDGCPYSHFAFLNSGSESIELATRITDIKRKTNNETFFIVLKDSFHGRTGKASTLSDSTKSIYKKYLKSFSKELPVKTVEINDIDGFVSVFNTYKIGSVIMEPVMGEGNPGICVNEAFYDCVRQMTKKTNSNLIIDSIQAGIRGTGYLSIVDYPHLKNKDPPDMEIFSKAISSGQYPLSVLAMKQDIYHTFKTGLYGNTMTGNPKALEVGYETLKRLDNDVVMNIQNKGERFKTMLQEIQEKYPHIATHVTGSGLLLALHINSNYNVCNGNNGLEYICRSNGLNVIHGGDNALRFTPYFLINDNEIELIKNLLDISFADFTKSIN